jgi:malic enzyme
MYIFPGIGLGALLARASRVTDSMVEQASIALAGSLDADERAAGLVYPRLDRIRDISSRIALAVVRAAQNAVRPALTRGSRSMRLLTWDLSYSRSTAHLRSATCRTTHS